MVPPFAVESVPANPRRTVIPWPIKRIYEESRKNKNKVPFPRSTEEAAATMSALPNFPTIPVPVVNLKNVSATRAICPLSSSNAVIAGMIASPTRIIAACPSAAAFLNA